MAEWLRSGLQIREGRFDSGSGLHFLNMHECFRIFEHLAYRPL